MSARTAAFIVALLDTVMMAVVAVALFMSGADPATGDLDTAAGFCVVLLYVLTAVPALVLVWRSRAPRAALGLALAFPAAFALVFTVVVIAYM